MPYDDPEACPEKFESPISGITVDELLAQANRALGGVPATGDASIADIYTAVTAINEGFDECRIIVTCPESLEEWCAIEACQEIYDCD